MPDPPRSRSTRATYGLQGWSPQIGLKLLGHLSLLGPGVKVSLCGLHVVDDSRWVRVAPTEVTNTRRCEACWSAAEQGAGRVSAPKP